MIKNRRRKKPLVNTLLDEHTFMFLKDGYVQFWYQDDKAGMILARTREMAQRFVEWYMKAHGIKLTIAEIGSVEGETLEAQLEASAREGANAAFFIRSIDGENVTCDVMLRTPKIWFVTLPKRMEP